MDSCDSTGRSSSYGGIQEKRQTQLTEEFSDWTAFVHIAFEPPYSFLYFTACYCWKVEKKTVVFLCPFLGRREAI